jgi:hypothetical protein
MHGRIRKSIQVLSPLAPGTGWSPHVLDTGNEGSSKSKKKSAKKNQTSIQDSNYDESLPDIIPDNNTDYEHETSVNFIHIDYYV